MINLEDLLSNTNIKAFLRLIRAGESSQDDDKAYRMLFGGELFDDFSQHPNRIIKSGQYSSTAAGAYQFLSRTWVSLQAEYHFPDFSPHSQDLGAVALLIQCGATDDIINGRIPEAIQRCNRIWASLPGSPYGQPTRTLSAALQTYNEFGGILAGAPVQPETVKPAPITESKPSIVVKAKTMDPISIITLGISALSKIVPAVSQMFPGSEVSERNMKAASVVLDAAKDAVGAVNTQDLVQKIDTDPSAVKAPILEAISTLVEVGGGIPEARKAATEMQKAGPFWNNPAFIVSLLLVVPVYAVIGSVLGLYGNAVWDDNVKMLIVGIVSNVVSGIMGFWLGSSFGSQKKTEALTK